MMALKDILNGAAGEGLLPMDKVGPLEAYLLRHGVPSGAAPVAARVTAASSEEVVDTEVPRFIRGFHDVLITIGIVILFVGIAGMWSGLAMAPVIIVLCEILVVRQRLALPAVALTISMMLWTGLAAKTGLDAAGYEMRLPDGVLLFLLPQVVVMALFYWRYRIPIALAALLLSVFLMLFVGVLAVVIKVAGRPDTLTDMPFLAVLIFLACAILLFAVAMRFDLSDPERLTRRSDIAFWLHLAVAPALLYATMALIFVKRGSMFPVFSGLTYGAAAEVLAVVAVLMAIGLVIDRRAVVTSGLLSLIAAVMSLVRQGNLQGESVLFVGLLVVGVVVLTIGVGWPSLRRAIVGALPDPIRERLPPVR